MKTLWKYDKYSKKVVPFEATRITQTRVYFIEKYGQHKERWVARNGNYDSYHEIRDEAYDYAILSVKDRITDLENGLIHLKHTLVDLETEKKGSL